MEQLLETVSNVNRTSFKIKSGMGIIEIKWAREGAQQLVREFRSQPSRWVAQPSVTPAARFCTLLAVCTMWCILEQTSAYAQIKKLNGSLFMITVKNFLG